MVPSEFAGHPTSYRTARELGLLRLAARGQRDGDTVFLFVDGPCRLHTVIPVRVIGDQPLDTPELVGGERLAGMVARTFVDRWLTASPWLLGRLELDRSGRYERTTGDRWLAILWAATPTGPGESLEDALTAAGLNKDAPNYRYAAAA
jgi:hypothetical protein